MSYSLVNWEKFKKLHSYKAHWYDDTPSDAIYSKQLIDWNLILEKFKQENLIFKKVHWYEYWRDNYIYVTLSCDNTTGLPSNYVSSRSWADIFNEFKLKNVETDYVLGYKGYPDFSDYIRETFAAAYFNNDDWTIDKTTFTNHLITEFITAFKDTTKRISKSKKQKDVKKRIQKIESDVDNAIYQLADDWKKYNVEFTKQDGSTQKISTIFTFSKGFTGYVDLTHYWVTIRKDINGNYEIYHSLSHYGETKIIKLKKNILADEIKLILTSLFKPYLVIDNNITSYIIPKELCN